MKIWKLMNLSLRNRSILWRKPLYPAPEPMPHTRVFWLAMGLVSVAVLLFIGYFIFFLTSRHDAFITNGEDLGIMDQAIWNLVHGNGLHQTICNTITDTNCHDLDGINRFSIHYEPILFPISLLYFIWPNPKTLQVFQTAIVALGAFPAFWLARLRLRSEVGGVAFALLYLLYPAFQYAAVFDFHAVTLTSALLLFTLYFMYTRQTVLLFVFAVLSLACKEEVAGVVACIGLWSVIFQHRWRSGLAIIGVALCWMGLGLLLVRYFSPTGKSLLSSRYSYLGNGPVDMALNILLHPVSMFKDHVLEPDHFKYLLGLFKPAGYLMLLAPWVLVLAAPPLALNLLSTSPNMYSGRFKYNSEIVPILIFAAIEGVVVLLWLTRHVVAFVQERTTTRSQHRLSRLFSAQPTLLPRVATIAAVTFLCTYMLFSDFQAGRAWNSYSAMPYADGFTWPKPTRHDNNAYRFLNQIPANATVATQTALVPHLSQRKGIYLFPYAVGHVDYVLLDITAYPYPFKYSDYKTRVKALLDEGQYGVIDEYDGFILLQKGQPPAKVEELKKRIDSRQQENPWY